VEELKTESEKQLNKYGLDEKSRKSMERTAIIKLAPVFAGHRPVHIDEAKDI
jgi:hypothetical protein